MIDVGLYHNIETINKIRNDYAHILDTKELEQKYLQFLQDLNIYWNTHYSIHQEKFQIVILQILFELVYIYNKERAKHGEGNIISGMSDKDINDMLLQDKKLHWQYCKVLTVKKAGYSEEYELECPHCNKGKIIREKDRTPGFKECSMTKCNVCGLTGDGYELNLATINKK